MSGSLRSMQTTQEAKYDKKVSQDAIQAEAELARSQAAFGRIQARIDALSDEELAAGNTNMAEGAVAAVGVAARISEPDILGRYQSLPATEFDLTHVNDLADLAWGTLHAARMADQARHGLSRARLPPDLVATATATRARMQACCEYHLDEHPVAGSELARLRAGQGHRDLADDLLGYAALYQEHRALLERDTRHYRAEDADEAVRLGETIYALLGDAITAESRSAVNQLVRAWTLLVRSYAEVSETGRWLFRHDAATAERLFPSLFTIGRSTRPRRRDDAPDTGEPADQVPAVADPVTAAVPPATAQA